MYVRIYVATYVDIFKGFYGYGKYVRSKLMRTVYPGVFAHVNGVGTFEYCRTNLSIPRFYRCGFSRLLPYFATII